MFTRLIHHLKRHAPSPGPMRRAEVCPPLRLQATEIATGGWRIGIREWLSTSWLAPSTRPLQSAPAAGSEHLARIRDEFLQALDDIRTQQAGMLLERIRISRTLRDLWHLRPEIFGLVALRYSQAEAQTRLDRLNRHFPTRSPRSGFAPLDSVGTQEPRASSQRR